METRLYIETWGCQMNRHDSEKIAGVLVREGYRLVDRIEQADVVLFNGCMVRQKAEDKVYGRIGAVVEEKRKRPILLGVGGCLGEIRGETLLERFGAVDFVFGPHGQERLPELIRRASEGARVVGSDGNAGSTEVPVHRSSPVTAMVTITEGCSNYCSYCVVPYARGPMQSRAPSAILTEVDRAVAAGYREVLLLGQNVNSYGRDHPSLGTFVDLLERVSEAGVERVRFTSAHPRDLTDALFETMARRENVMPHIHAACQSGSDRILAAMNRGYAKAEFLHTVRRGREIVPELNFTTDLIVGFPGESDDDFAETLDVIERGRFGSVFVAKYSERPGTKSATLPDDVPPEMKDHRLQRVLERQREIALDENGRFLDGDVEVLVEGEGRDGSAYGRARDHRTVSLAGSGLHEVGDLVTVRVCEVSAASLCGRPLVAVAPGRPGKERA